MFTSHFLLVKLGQFIKLDKNSTIGAIAYDENEQRKNTTHGLHRTEEILYAQGISRAEQRRQNRHLLCFIKRE